MVIHDNLTLTDEFAQEEKQVDSLTEILHILFPHRRTIPEDSYTRAARRCLRAAQRHPFFRVGFASFLASITDDSRGVEETLQSVAAGETFRFLLDTAIYYFYADPAVWAALGYEGESSSHGGYVDRGFADLDWLPEPRIEELGEPLDPIPHTDSSRKEEA